MSSEWRLKIDRAIQERDNRIAAARENALAVLRNLGENPTDMVALCACVNVALALKSAEGDKQERPTLRRIVDVIEGWGT